MGVCCSLVFVVLCLFFVVWWVACRALFVASCLFVCWLFGVCCVCGLLFVVCCLLRAVCCVLLVTVPMLLFVGRCLMLLACHALNGWWLCVDRCLLIVACPMVRVLC